MTEILTTNQLTPIHGAPPTDSFDDSKIERGLIVYLEILGENGGLFARIFWTKYGYNGAPANQRDFVTEILKAANAGDLKNWGQDLKSPYAPGNQRYFEKDISIIRFGWKPIKVSYVLNSRFAKFQSVDGTKPLQQPVVFRRDKVVNGERQEYLPNYSFYNLDSYSEEYATILEFSNHMLIDERGTSIGPEPELEADKIFYPYCLDIPIEFEQSVIVSAFPEFLSFGRELATMSSETDESGLQNFITFVFDPPQGNGGGGGVPSQP